MEQARRCSGGAYDECRGSAEEHARAETVQFTLDGDRLFFIQLYRWFPSILKAMTIIRPETLVRWRRAGFRRYWRWRSRRVGGRP